MGASLLAMAVYQSTSESTDSPLSRAGSLPQGCMHPEIQMFSSCKRSRIEASIPVSSSPHSASICAGLACST
ncbi:hypothetical protein F7R15_23460 [Pseudomonas reinekei]|uniref:Uncharacterized protein n=1 Tax=Pseudomonas reinekei TaxID=395598 RepID=A0A6H9RKM7_PSERE|nr:hypothetical protein F7R15_23460 [Pseudomonas reinekei]